MKPCLCDLHLFCGYINLFAAVACSTPEYKGINAVFAAWNFYNVWKYDRDA